jgi:hypothetical protein
VWYWPLQISANVARNYSRFSRFVTMGAEQYIQGV